ncbi:MAG: CDP-diacylglycerol--glycerol-3-phosphate 3-phosphatidyltransferase [Eubacterium sp.]|nr:CDP-diacylglycerol--glycerol-3-phosphate 3-phosphatidyltransferase [Eubacterium sp.]
MNLPNKLTCIRMALIPVFVLLFNAPFAAGRYLALVVFILASLTDMADGRIARKYNLVTDFGKFMDPLADKLLVCSALICLVGSGEIAAWIVIIIIAREFIISGFRLVAADNGLVIAASWWGKIKTVVQMVMIIVMLLNISSWTGFERVLIAAALVLTVVSLADYILKNRSVLGTTK